MVPTIEQIKSNIISRLNAHFRNSQSTNESQVVYYQGARIINKTYDWAQVISNDLYNMWNNFHNSLIAFNLPVNQIGQAYIGQGGSINGISFALYINRIYPNALLFNVHCNAIEQYINESFNSYKNNYHFINMPFTSDQQGGSNISGSLGGNGIGDESGFNNLRNNLDNYLIGYGFSNPLQADTLNFNEAVSGAVNYLFDIWKQSIWFGIVITISNLGNGGRII